MFAYPRRKHSEVMREALSLAGARVLDVGCGDGALVRLMTRQGARATGLEISDEKLARASAAEPAGDETYRLGRGESLPFAESLFDIVVFFNSLHHVPVPAQDAALAEAARVLVPGGLLYALEPLAEGTFFALLRPVDDETEVRAAAYGALKRAVAGGTFTELREFIYSALYAYVSFEDFKDQVTSVDETRRLAFEAHESSLRTQFDLTAVRTDKGYTFEHPSRLNLLRRV